MAQKSSKNFDLRERRFVDEYLKSGNAKQAAILAGYAESTADQKAFTWVRDGKVKPHVYAAVKKAEDKRSERTLVDADWIFNRLVDIAKANPNELTRVEVSACRHCHGQDHEYQWRTENEFNKAQEEYWDLPDNKRENVVAPVISGGFGYSKNLSPNIDCPECEGLGRDRVVLGDTTRLSREGLALYAGVKQTKTGIEVKQQDQMKALEMLARRLNFFEAENTATADAFANAIVEIQKRTSKMPINSGAAERNQE